MAIDIYRDDTIESTVVCKFDRKWAWEEMMAAAQRVNELLDTVECGHVILLVPNNTLRGRDDIARNLSRQRSFICAGAGRR